MENTSSMWLGTDHLGPANKRYLKECWFNAGISSTTMVQQYINIDWMYRALLKKFGAKLECLADLLEWDPERSHSDDVWMSRTHQAGNP